jgi:hypothetical protein
MMKRMCLVGVGLLWAAHLSAQAGPNTEFIWTQPARDAATAQALTYRYYVDGDADGKVLAGVTCAGAPTILCVAPVPAFTPGNHSIQLTAGNAAGETAKSVPFAFSYGSVLPEVPVGLKLR